MSVRYLGNGFAGNTVAVACLDKGYGKNGMTSAADVVHVGRRRRPMRIASAISKKNYEISSIKIAIFVPFHTLLYMSIVGYQASRESLNIRPLFRMLSDLQRTIITSPKQIGDAFLINLQVTNLHPMCGSPFRILRHSLEQGFAYPRN